MIIITSQIGKSKRHCKNIQIFYRVSNFLDVFKRFLRHLEYLFIYTDYLSILCFISAICLVRHNNAYKKYLRRNQKESLLLLLTIMFSDYRSKTIESHWFSKS